jgi:hypothetical protein
MPQALHAPCLGVGCRRRQLLGKEGKRSIQVPVFLHDPDSTCMWATDFDCKFKKTWRWQLATLSAGFLSAHACRLRLNSLSRSLPPHASCVRTASRSPDRKPGGIPASLLDRGAWKIKDQSSAPVILVVA